MKHNTNVGNRTARVSAAFLVLAAAFASAILTGYFDVEWARAAVASLVPVAVYAAVLFLSGKARFQIFPALMFALGGLSFGLIYNSSSGAVNDLLTAGVIFSLLATVFTWRQCRSTVAALFLLTASAFLLPTSLLGFIPYLAAEFDNMRALDSRRGLYLMDKGNKTGLHGRYGVILNPEYSGLNFLDETEKEYVVVNTPRSGNLSSECGVYNLRQRRFVITPNCGIDSIGGAGSGEYKMIDAWGRHFATFTLPDPDSERENAAFTPRFADAETPIQEILRLSENADIDTGGNQYRERMRQRNPHAFSLLGKILAMSVVECSPANDLAFGSAIASVIKADPHYNGNTDRALKEIDGILPELHAGNQPDLNYVASIERLMTSLRLSLKYGEYVEVESLFSEEYVAWHHLMEALVRYYEYIESGSTWYSSKPGDMEYMKQWWLDQRLKMLETELKIISGKGGYTAKDLMLEEELGATRYDAEESFRHYGSDDSPNYYSPVWEEIRPAFYDWLYRRNLVSESLPADRMADFDAVSASLESRFAGIIVSLDRPEFVPAR